MKCTSIQDNKHGLYITANHSVAAISDWGGGGRGREGVTSVWQSSRFLQCSVCVCVCVCVCV